MTNEVKIISLGGIGDVTKNMYVYETTKDILVVDCGVGFPGPSLPGVDLVIPDISYLLKNRQKIKAIVLTHGHEDHIGALPYIWPSLKVPIFATALTAALAENKFFDFGIDVKINKVNYGQKLSLGDFQVEFIRITHSVPQSANLSITTPLGIFFHASDFKFDWTPMDNNFSQVGRIAELGDQGVLCLLSDSLRSEREGYTLSERVIEEQLENEIRNCPGKFMVTAHSSDIFRWQMVMNVAKRHNRKIVIQGRSVEQAVKTGYELGYLKDLRDILINQNEIKRFPDSSLCILISGSQGQPDSALSRLANNEFNHLKAKEGDVVVFSADPIPGNENAVHMVIDDLTRLGARVSYSEVTDALHVSGHGASEELKLMMALTRAKFLLPIGGTFRQMKKYADLAKEFGYLDKQIILTDSGQPVVFTKDKWRLEKKMEVEQVLVDGLGVGDVGQVVLRDRRQMSEDGVVVVVLTIEISTGQLVEEPDIISKGFVYMKESKELIEETKRLIKKTVKSHTQKQDIAFLRKKIANSLEGFLWHKTGRRPLILPVVVEV